MKIALSILIFLTPVLTIAQNSFSVVGTGSVLKAGDKIYLVYKQEQKVVFDSAIVKSNTFKFNGSVLEPSFAHIYKNENPMVMDEPSDELDFFIEKGTIKIAVSDSLKHSVITGTASNVEYQQLNNSLKTYHQRIENNNKRFFALNASQQKDINNIAEYRALDRKLLNEMAPLQFKFIKAHPNSYVSLLTLKQILKTKVMIDEINGVYAGLSLSAKTSTIGKEIAITLKSSMKATIGTTAYDFTLPDINNRVVALNSFRGKYVLVDFWASWCLPCREENPNILLAYNKFNAQGFTVVGISIENKSERLNWLNAVQTDKLPWTQLLDGESQAKKVKTVYGIVTIPSNVLIDPTGKIIAKDLRDRALMDKLAEIFAP